MAAEPLDINAELKKLERIGPQRLYMLFGEEEYLLSIYYDTLKNMVIPDGDIGFNYKKFDNSEPNITDVVNSLDTLPFLSDRNFVELRGFDPNKYKNSEELISALENIPDYCTVVIIPDSTLVPDMRLKLCKKIKEIGTVINFTTQPAYRLVKWIIKRFQANNKKISEQTAERLIFISGDNMNALIPEIEKISAYSKGTEVTVNDIKEAAHHIPESDVFDMLDNLIEGNNTQASNVLSDLLFSKETGDPVYLISMIGMELKHILAAKIASEKRIGASKLVSAGIFKYEKMAYESMQHCKKLNVKTIVNLVDLCSEADYRMKQSQLDGVDILMEVFTLIANGVS